MRIIYFITFIFLQLQVDAQVGTGGNFSLTYSSEFPAQYLIPSCPYSNCNLSISCSPPKDPDWYPQIQFFCIGVGDDNFKSYIIYGRANWRYAYSWMGMRGKPIKLKVQNEVKRWKVEE